MKRVQRGSYVHVRKCLGSDIKGTAEMKLKTRPVLAFELFNSLDVCEALAPLFFSFYLKHYSSIGRSL
jgi:hypothetical protein